MTGPVPFAVHRFTSYDRVPDGHPYPDPTSYQAYFLARVAEGAVPEAGEEAVEARFFSPPEVRALDFYADNGDLYEEALRRATSPTVIRPNGEPMAEDVPAGAQVVVVRPSSDDGAGWETLVLERVGGAGEGNWAWGPPGGARYPGEAPTECALRELEEETELRLTVERVDGDPPDWLWFVAHADASAVVMLSEEHASFAWVSLDEARRRTRPDRVLRVFDAVAAMLDPR